MTEMCRYSSLLLGVGLAACGPAVHSMTFMSPAPQPKPANHPIIFYRDTRPTCSYEEIGTVSSRKRSGFVSMDKITESLRQRARQMGGDAIVGMGEHIETRGASIVGSTVVANRDPVFSGTVIRFKDPGCTR